MSNSLLYTSGAIFACILWSTAFATVKLGLEGLNKPLTLAGVRFILSGIILFPFWKNYKNSFSTITKEWKYVVATSFFNTFLLYALFFYGMNLVPGAIGAIITGSSPLTTSVVSHVFQKNDKMSRGKTLSILIGVFGIIIISAGKNIQNSAEYSYMAGILLLLGATISSALGNIVVHKSKHSSPLNPLVLNSTQIFIGGAGLLLLALLVEGKPDFTGKTIQFYLALTWLSVLSAVAFSIWFWLLRKPGVKVSQLNQWKFIVPVTGASLSWLIIPGESPDTYSISGMLLIAISLILYYKTTPKSYSG